MMDRPLASAEPVTTRPVPASFALRDKGLRLARRLYLPRCIGLGLGGICVGGALYQHGAAPWAWVLLALHALAWPHLAYLWSRRSAEPFAQEHANLRLDSAFGAFWVPAMGFNLLPSVLILAMLSMDNIAVGGLRLLLHGLLANLLGLLLGLLLFGLELELASDLATTVACLPFLVVFPLTIGSVTFRQAVQLSEQKKRLYWLSQRDALSGLYTRAYWEERLDEELQHFQRHARTSTLLLTDIDHFKQINDRYGHLVGDEVIQRVGAILRDHVRQGDVAARLGGDEFCILLPQADAKDALRVVQRIQASLAQLHFGPAGQTLQATMSYGIAQLEPALASRTQWVEAADQALYAVKRSQRGEVQIHGDRAEKAKPAV